LAEALTAEEVSRLSRAIAHLLSKTKNAVANADTTKILNNHLNHALAAAFGGALRMEGKPIILSNFDAQAADQQFRNELKALRDAKKSDQYLLTIFGMAAGTQAGKDAAIVAEWQTGRALNLPASLRKIQLINETLEQFIKLSSAERTKNAPELLSQTRALQNIIHKDIETLSADAHSIHGAKTLMQAHEKILARYFQTFKGLKGSLTDTFGEAAYQKKHAQLSTNLAAAQIHASHQSAIHERLMHKMMENVSDLSTRMSFLSLSMNQLATMTTIRSLLASPDQTIASITRSALLGAGLKEKDINTFEKMTASDIDALIAEKAVAITQALDPFVQEIDEIHDLLALADMRGEEQLLMITDQRPQITPTHDLED
jgi:hypothetical protein